MAVSRALKSVFRRSRRDLALSVGKAWEGFTVQWLDWKAG